MLSLNHSELTDAFPLSHCSIWVVKLVEEALYNVRPVGSGVQAELTSWTLSILIHFPCEDERVFHQCDHPEAVSLDGQTGPPSTSEVMVPLTIPSSHPSSKPLSLAAPKPSHKSQNSALQFQSATCPLAYSHPGRLTQSAPLQAPHVEQLGGQDARHTGIHLDQACCSREGSVGKKP